MRKCDAALQGSGAGAVLQQGDGVRFGVVGWRRGGVWQRLGQHVPDGDAVLAQSLAVAGFLGEVGNQ